MTLTTKLVPLLAALAFVAVPTVASAATITAPVVADASIEEQNPTTNFGSGLLRIDGSPQRWALLQYNVPALSGSVTAAKLRVYKRVGSPSQVVQVQSAPCTWAYNTVTWNTRPALGAVLATAVHPAGEGWMEFNLPASAVAAGARCFALTKTPAADIWITADDIDAANPSQLVVTTADTPPPAAACADGVDNDADGKVDYPADPGCSSTTDTDETDAVIPPPSGVAKCGGTPVTATPSTIHSIIDNNNSVTINAQPGTYGNLSMHKRTADSCVEIHCTVSAKVGEGPNNSGCIIAGQSDIESIHNVTIDGFVNKTTGAETYGFALYDESPDVNMHARIANNVFDDSTDHDVSTKERVEWTEVENNIFLHCRRHCWEIGQNGNIPSRPSTTGTAVFRGNIVDSACSSTNTCINGLTQRYNVTLRVENNDFRSVPGNTITSWPFWTFYLGESNMVPGTETVSAPKVPLRTTVTGNKFSSGNRLRFTGRGVSNDTVLIRGNTGSVPSCVRDNMDAQNDTTSAAHSNEETTAPPRLDLASDLAC